MDNIDLTREDGVLENIAEMLSPLGVTRATLCEDGEGMDLINLHFGDKGTVSICLDHLYNKRIMFFNNWVHLEN